MAKKSRMGAHRKLSGFTTPKIGFLFAYSNMDPTCTAARNSMLPRHVSRLAFRLCQCFALRKLLHGRNKEAAYVETCGVCSVGMLLWLVKGSPRQWQQGLSL